MVIVLSVVLKPAINLMYAITQMIQFGVNLTN